MAVSKGEKITVAQINSLIDKLNSECTRRGVSRIEEKAVQNTFLSFSLMDSINMKRIEVSKKYRATVEHSDIASCEQRSDNLGTPSDWDGRDLKTTRVNEKEDMLAVGGKAYSSQYNLLLSDIEKLNAMCSCNAYRNTYTDRYVTCFTNCSCNSNIVSPCSEWVIVDSCPSQKTCCQAIHDTIACGCEYVILCRCDGVASCGCNDNRDCGCYMQNPDMVTCSINTCYSNCECQSEFCFSNKTCPTNWGCKCDDNTRCSCESEYCSTNCSCNGHLECTCQSQCPSNLVNCGAQGADKCNCEYVCSCVKVCREYAI